VPVSAPHPAVFLSSLQVILCPVAIFDCPFSSFFQDFAKHVSCDFGPAALSNSGRHIFEYLIQKLFSLILYILGCEVCSQQPDATRDIITDAAGAHDAVFLVECCNPSNAESVALMRIRHGKAGLFYARKHSHIPHLFQCLVFADILH